MKRIHMPIMAAACIHAAAAREIHVSTQGDDQNDGSGAKPLQTISAAARIAQPGDSVTVHEGICRFTLKFCEPYFDETTPISPPSGPATDSFNG